MSNHLAIATVTATMQLILRSAIGDWVPGAEVTSLRPESIGSSGHNPGINVYLYLSNPNPALRNQDLPLHGGSAKQFIRRPQAALDLYYLLTFHGKENTYDAEQLLSLASIALHANATISRPEIIRAIASAPNGTLAGSNLASQLESVSFTPVTLSLDDLHKLWSLFSPVPYMLSNVYMASVVLLEADVPMKEGLPVRTTQVAVMTGVPPVLASVQPARIPFAPDAKLRIMGDHFTKDVVGIVGSTLVRPQLISKTELTLALPQNLSAGPQEVRLARIEPAPLDASAAPETIMETDAAQFLVLPVIQGTPRHSRQTDPLTGEPISVVSVTPAPAMRFLQPALVNLNARGTGAARKEAVFMRVMRFPIEERFWKELEKHTVSAELRNEFRQNGFDLSSSVKVQVRPQSQEILVIDEGQTHPVVYVVRHGVRFLGVYYGLLKNDPPATVAFQFQPLSAGTYLIRLVVDGAESPLTLDSHTHKYNGPLLEVR